MKLLLLFIFVFFSFEAEAQIFKCVSADGKVVYQQVECSSASRSNVIKNQKDAPIEEQIRANERHQKVLELNRKAAEEEELDKRRREKNHIEILEAERRRDEARNAEIKALERMYYPRDTERKKVDALEDIARSIKNPKPTHCRPDSYGGTYCD